MKQIVNDIATAMQRSFYYARVEEANAMILDNGTFPCVLMIQPESGAIEIIANGIIDKPQLEVYFLNVVDMQDKSETNAAKLSNLLTDACEFVSRLSDDTRINPGLMQATYNVVPENLFDVNVIGLVLTISPEYVKSSRCY